MIQEISVNYVLVKKFEEPIVEDGFKVVEIQDSFVYKGSIVQVPKTQPCYLGDHPLAVGDVVVFAKYSPDTQEIDINGEKMKFVLIRDLLAVL